MKNILSLVCICILLVSCRTTPTAKQQPDMSNQQSTSSFSNTISSNVEQLVASWSYQHFRWKSWGIPFSFPLPDDFVIVSDFGGALIKYNYWPTEETSIKGFAFVIGRYAYSPDDPPQGFLYDDVCKDQKVKPYKLDSIILNNFGIHIEKVLTACSSTVVYLMHYNADIYAVYPVVSLPPDRLPIIEEILKRAKWK